MSEQALIQLENIIKKYPQTVALNDVSLEFYPGEIHAVVGENGAGKSTLMNIIAGLCKPDGGILRFDGQAVPAWNPRLAHRHGIAMVHQHFTLIPEMTVTENILLAGGRHTHFILNKKAAAGEITRLCNAYGLDMEPGALAGSLSPGQKQRAEIIKALYYQCRVLILDEPTAVLTGGESERLFSVLRQLAASGTAVLLISHKLDEIFDVSSRITILRQGTVAGRTKPGEMSVPQVARLMISGGEDVPAEEVGDRNSENISDRKLDQLRGRGVSGRNVSSREQEHVGMHAAASRPANAAMSGSDMSMSGNHALEIRNLYAAGPDGRSGVAGVSLTVDAGQIYGVAGVDGNGQSTLAAAIMGLVSKSNENSHGKPCGVREQGSKFNSGNKLNLGSILKQDGVLFIDGEDMTCASVQKILKKSVGYIPEDCQETGIIREMTLEENLILNSFSQEKYGHGPLMNWGNVRREAVRAMCDMDIRAFSGKQLAGTLSGGNQQKLVIARELGKRPKIMLAVNPTRGIDANAAQKIRNLFLQARREGCAILLISTDLDEILYLSDRIGVMYEGRMAAEFDGLLKESNGEIMDIRMVDQKMSGGALRCDKEKLLCEQIGLAMAGHRM